MRRVLCVLSVAFIVIGCASGPTPSPSAAPSVRLTPSVSASPSAVPSTSVAPSTSSVSIVCGPLAAKPTSCAAAIEEGVRFKGPGVAWSSARVDPPETTCAGVPQPCRAPEIIVRFFASDATEPVAVVPMIANGTGWAYMGLIR